CSPPSNAWSTRNIGCGIARSWTTPPTRVFRSSVWSSIDTGISCASAVRCASSGKIRTALTSGLRPSSRRTNSNEPRAQQEYAMSIRRVRKLTAAKPTLEGAGVHLRRAFGFGQTSDYDPFLLLDDFRNDVPEDYLAGFPWHPHRGIETITY